MTESTLMLSALKEGCGGRGVEGNREKVIIIKIKKQKKKKKKKKKKTHGPKSLREQVGFQMSAESAKGICISDCLR